MRNYLVFAPLILSISCLVRHERSLSEFADCDYHISGEEIWRFKYNFSSQSFVISVQQVINSTQSLPLPGVPWQAAHHALNENLSLSTEKLRICVKTLPKHAIFLNIKPIVNDGETSNFNFSAAAETPTESEDCAGPLIEVWLLESCTDRSHQPNPDSPLSRTSRHLESRSKYTNHNSGSSVRRRKRRRMRNSSINKNHRKGHVRYIAYKRKHGKRRAQDKKKSLKLGRSRSSISKLNKHAVITNRVEQITKRRSKRSMPLFRWSKVLILCSKLALNHYVYKRITNKKDPCRKASRYFTVDRNQPEFSFQPNLIALQTTSNQFKVKLKWPTNYSDDTSSIENLLFYVKFDGSPPSDMKTQVVVPTISSQTEEGSIPTTAVSQAAEFSRWSPLIFLLSSILSCSFVCLVLAIWCKQPSCFRPAKKRCNNTFACHSEKSAILRLEERKKHKGDPSCCKRAEPMPNRHCNTNRKSRTAVPQSFTANCASCPYAASTSLQAHLKASHSTNNPLQTGMHAAGSAATRHNSRCFTNISQGQATAALRYPTAQVNFPHVVRLPDARKWSPSGSARSKGSSLKSIESNCIKPPPNRTLIREEHLSTAFDFQYQEATCQTKVARRSQSPSCFSHQQYCAVNAEQVNDHQVFLPPSESAVLLSQTTRCPSHVFGHDSPPEYLGPPGYYSESCTKQA